MIPCLAVIALAAVADPNSLEGSVRVLGPALDRTVALHVADQDIRLEGDFVDEVGRLAGARVEVLGAQVPGGRFKVQSYRIVAVDAEGSKPIVGHVVRLAAESVGLRDGAGEPILLSLNPGGKRRLLDHVGAKIWVCGQKLLSGELAVQRFGVLKDVPAVAGETPKGRDDKVP